jgi:hypothetical protein
MASRLQFRDTCGERDLARRINLVVRHHVSGASEAKGLPPFSAVRLETSRFIRLAVL